MRRRHSMQYLWKSFLYWKSSVTSTMPTTKCSRLARIGFGADCKAVSCRSSWILEEALRRLRKNYPCRRPNKDRWVRPRLYGVPFLSWWSFSEEELHDADSHVTFEEFVSVPMTASLKTCCFVQSAHVFIVAVWRIIDTSEFRKFCSWRHGLLLQTNFSYKEMVRNRRR